MKRKSDSSRKTALARYYEKNKKRKNDVNGRNEKMYKQELNRQYKRKSREKKKLSKKTSSKKFPLVESWQIQQFTNTAFLRSTETSI